MRFAANFYPRHSSTKHSSKKRLRAADNSIRLRENLAPYLIQIVSAFGTLFRCVFENAQSEFLFRQLASNGSAIKTTVNITLTGGPDTQ